MNDLSIAHEYQIAPMYRRCCWYVIIGMLLIALTAILLDQLLLLPKKAELLLGCGISLILAACAAAPLFWKLRVDESGIIRHRVVGTDTWTWSDFASGNLEKQFRYAIKDASRPFWRRRLSLDYLDPHERNELWDKINSYYCLPSSPQIPDSLEIKYCWRRTLRLDRDGIHIIAGNNFHESLWNEVQYVVIVMFDLKRRDFHNLELSVSNETVQLKMVSHQGGSTPSWKGAAAETIFEFLEQHVPSDKLQIVTSASKSQNGAYLASKLSAAEKELRELKVCILIMSPLMLGCLVWMAIVDGIWKGLFFGILYSILFIPVFSILYRNKSSGIKELTERLSALESKQSSC